MAAPNLKNPTTVTGKTIGYAVTTSMAAALSNDTNSGKAFKVNSVYCANVNGSVNADITLQHWNGTLGYEVAHTLTVPADSTQILITRDAYIYLEEGQSLRAQASTSGHLELVIGYEEIS